MRLCEKVVWVFLIAVIFQISIKHCLPRSSKLSLRDYLDSFKQTKKNSVQTLKLPSKGRERNKALTRNKNVISGHVIPSQNSMYRVYEFPDIEYPTYNSPRNPFYVGTGFSTDNYEITKRLAPDIDYKTLNDFKKDMRLNRKLNRINIDQNYHIKREMPSLKEYSSTFDPIWLKDSETFPEVQYPMNAMEIWVPNYWNPYIFTEIAKNDPTSLPVFEAKRKTKRTHQLYKQPVNSETSQYIEEIKKLVGQIKNSTNTKFSMDAIDLNFTRSSNYSENTMNSDSDIPNMLLTVVNDFSNNAVQILQASNHSTEHNSSSYILTSSNDTIRDEVSALYLPIDTAIIHSNESATTVIEVDIKSSTPIPLPYKILDDKNICSANEHNKTNEESVNTDYNTEAIHPVILKNEECLNAQKLYEVQPNLLTFPSVFSDNDKMENYVQNLTERETNSIFSDEYIINAESKYTDDEVGPWNVKIPIPLDDIDNRIINKSTNKKASKSSSKSVIVVPANNFNQTIKLAITDGGADISIVLFVPATENIFSTKSPTSIVHKDHETLLAPVNIELTPARESASLKIPLTVSSNKERIYIDLERASNSSLYDVYKDNMSSLKGNFTPDFVLYNITNDESQWKTKNVMPLEKRIPDNMYIVDIIENSTNIVEADNINIRGVSAYDNSTPIVVDNNQTDNLSPDSNKIPILLYKLLNGSIINFNSGDAVQLVKSVTDNAPNLKLYGHTLPEKLISNASKESLFKENLQNIPLVDLAKTSPPLRLHLKHPDNPVTQKISTFAKNMIHNNIPLDNVTNFLVSTMNNFVENRQRISPSVSIKNPLLLFDPNTLLLDNGIPDNVPKTTYVPNDEISAHIIEPGDQMLHVTRNGLSVTQNRDITHNTSPNKDSMHLIANDVLQKIHSNDFRKDLHLETVLDNISTADVTDKSPAEHLQSDIRLCDPLQSAEQMFLSDSIKNKTLRINNPMVTQGNPDHLSSHRKEHNTVMVSNNSPNSLVLNFDNEDVVLSAELIGPEEVPSVNFHNDKVRNRNGISPSVETNHHEPLQLINSKNIPVKENFHENTNEDFNKNIPPFMWYLRPLHSLSPDNKSNDNTEHISPSTNEYFSIGSNLNSGYSDSNMIKNHKKLFLSTPLNEFDQTVDKKQIPLVMNQILSKNIHNKSHDALKASQDLDKKIHVPSSENKDFYNPLTSDIMRFNSSPQYLQVSNAKKALATLEDFQNLPVTGSQSSLPLMLDLTHIDSLPPHINETDSMQQIATFNYTQQHKAQPLQEHKTAQNLSSVSDKLPLKGFSNQTVTSITSPVATLIQLRHAPDVEHVQNHNHTVKIDTDEDYSTHTDNILSNFKNKDITLLADKLVQVKDIPFSLNEIIRNILIRALNKTNLELIKGLKLQQPSIKQTELGQYNSTSDINKDDNSPVKKTFEDELLLGAEESREFLANLTQYKRNLTLIGDKKLTVNASIYTDRLPINYLDMNLPRDNMTSSKNIEVYDISKDKSHFLTVKTPEQFIGNLSKNNDFQDIFAQDINKENTSEKRSGTYMSYSDVVKNNSGISERQLVHQVLDTKDTILSPINNNGQITYVNKSSLPLMFEPKYLNSLPFYNERNYSIQISPNENIDQPLPMNTLRTENLSSDLSKILMQSSLTNISDDSVAMRDLPVAIDENNDLSSSLINTKSDISKYNSSQQIRDIDVREDLLENGDFSDILLSDVNDTNLPVRKDVMYLEKLPLNVKFIPNDKINTVSLQSDKKSSISSININAQKMLLLDIIKSTLPLLARKTMAQKLGTNVTGNIQINKEYTNSPQSDQIYNTNKSIIPLMVDLKIPNNLSVVVEENEGTTMTPISLVYVPRINRDDLSLLVDEIVIHTDTKIKNNDHPLRDRAAFKNKVINFINNMNISLKEMGDRHNSNKDIDMVNRTSSSEKFMHYLNTASECLQTDLTNKNVQMAQDMLTDYFPDIEEKHADTIKNDEITLKQELGLPIGTNEFDKPLLEFSGIQLSNSTGHIDAIPKSFSNILNGNSCTANNNPIIKPKKSMTNNFKLYENQSPFSNMEDNVITNPNISRAAILSFHKMLSNKTLNAVDMLYSENASSEVIQANELQPGSQYFNHTRNDVSSSDKRNSKYTSNSEKITDNLPLLENKLLHTVLVNNNTIDLPINNDIQDYLNKGSSPLILEGKHLESQPFLDKNNRNKTFPINNMALLDLGKGDMQFSLENFSDNTVTSFDKRELWEPLSIEKRLTDVPNYASEVLQKHKVSLPTNIILSSLENKNYKNIVSDINKDTSLVDKLVHDFNTILHVPQMDDLNPKIGEHNSNPNKSNTSLLKQNLTKPTNEFDKLFSSAPEFSDTERRNIKDFFNKTRGNFLDSEDDILSIGNSEPVNQSEQIMTNPFELLENDVLTTKLLSDKEDGTAWKPNIIITNITNRQQYPTDKELLINVLRVNFNNSHNNDVLLQVISNNNNSDEKISEEKIFKSTPAIEKTPVSLLKTPENTSIFADITSSTPGVIMTEDNPPLVKGKKTTRAKQLVKFLYFSV